MSIFSKTEQQLLINTAQQSIQEGLNFAKPLVVNITQYTAILQENRACFVTLELDNNLRGCIGSLIAHRPLINDVAYNAYQAAFHDPRFSPVTQAEYPLLAMHISILSPAERIFFTSELDLINKIRPQVDGLILTIGNHRGTFLPSVWEQLPEPKQFLQHLKNKAGLPKDYWDENLIIERYTTEMINSSHLKP